MLHYPVFLGCQCAVNVTVSNEQRGLTGNENAFGNDLPKPRN